MHKDKISILATKRFSIPSNFNDKPFPDINSGSPTNEHSYMLSGSVAMSVYILPGATRDFNFVVHLQEKYLEALVAHFVEGYYYDLDAVREAVKRKSIFNIIDHASGLKADFVILKDTPHRQMEFSPRTKVD